MKNSDINMNLFNTIIITILYMILFIEKINNKLINYKLFFKFKYYNLINHLNTI